MTILGAPAASEVDGSTEKVRRPGGKPVARRLRETPLRTWFLVIALPFGLAIALTTPPGLGLDEPQHWFRVWAVAHGQFVATRNSDGRVGSPESECVDQYLAPYSRAAGQPHAFDFLDYWHFRCPNSSSHFVAFDNTAITSPVAYAPQAVVVALASAVGTPMEVIFFLGRLAALATYLALIWTALSVAPRGRHVLFVVAALPMSLVQASLYTSDTLAIGLGILLVALVLRCLDEDTNPKWFLAVVCTAAAFALSKNTLVVLTPLLLLVPNRVIGERRRAWVAKSLALVVIGAPTLLWYEKVKNISFAYVYPPGAINTKVQTAVLLHHPFGFVRILWHSLVSYGQESNVFRSIVWWIGNFRIGSDPGPPVWLATLAFVLLFGAYMSETGPRNRLGGSGILRYSKAALPLVLAALTVLAIEVTFWIAWTPIHSTVVVGIQGRYFLPLLAVPMVTVAVLRDSPSSSQKDHWLAIAAGALLVACLVAVYFRYYYWV